MNPIISIIIPAYNAEDTIQRCLISVTNQTIHNIEIIVIDDGSTDATCRLATDYAKSDERITVISQENRGQGNARNHGITLACGKYIGFVDADDTIEPNMYQVLLDGIEEHNADISECNIVDIFDNGFRQVQLLFDDEVVVVTDCSDYLKSYIYTAKHSYECCNKLIKREFLLENNICFLDNNKIYAEDLLYNLDMMLSLKKIVLINKPLYNYYQSSQGHCRSTDLDKAGKFCLLFKIFLEHAKAQNKYEPIELEASRFAAKIILPKIAHLLYIPGGQEAAKEIFDHSDLKNYLRLSYPTMGRVKHRILMFLFLYLPYSITFPLMKFYYVGRKKDYC